MTIWPLVLPRQIFRHCAREGVEALITSQARLATQGF
jgi:hypothetical protein